MKVLTVFNDYLQMGGERQSVQLISEGLRNGGVNHNLFIVTNENLLGGNRIHTASKLFQNQKLEQALRSKIANFQPELVHVENTFPSLGLALFRVLSELRIPWIQTIRNYRSTCIAGSHYRAGRKCVDCLGPIGSMPALVHRCYRRSIISTAGALAVRESSRRRSALNPARATIFTSQFLRDFYSEPGRTFPRPVVIGNPLKFEAQEEVRKPRNRTWDFAFVGRLELEKGLDIFLEIATRMPQHSFVIAGGGRLAEKAIRAARTLTNLTYRGELSTVEVGALFGESRWVLVPSRWNEPFGRVAIEALAQGCIPIVSGTGGLREIPEDLEIPELVVRSESIKDWLKTVRKVTSWSHMSQIKAQRYLREEVHSKFGLESVVRRHVCLYHQMLV